MKRSLQIALLMAALCTAAFSESIRVTSLSPLNGNSNTYPDLGVLDPSYETVYTVAATDTNGWQRIDKLQLIFDTVSPTSSTANACIVRYNGADSTFSLLKDAGNTWGLAMAGPYLAIDQNSQCRLDMTLTKVVTSSGNTLTVQFAVGFIAGGKSYGQWLYAENAGGSINSGYVRCGTWTTILSSGIKVSLFANGNGTRAYTVPVDGSPGQSTLWMVDYADLNTEGYEGIDEAQLIISTETAPPWFSGACVVKYDKHTDAFWLLEADGTTWDGPMPAFRKSHARVVHQGNRASHDDWEVIPNESLRNENCALQSIESRATGSGSHLGVEFNLSFYLPILGPSRSPITMNSFAYARNSDASVTSGYVPGPSVNIVAGPEMGTRQGPRQTFKFPSK